MIVKGLTKFAKSGVGTNLYKWATSEKGKLFLCTGMPLIETGLATASRVYATERQKLNRREKNILQAGHIVPAVFSIGIGSFLNKKVFDLADDVAKRLNVVDVGRISDLKNALRVAFPIFSTYMLTRLIMPTITAFVSSNIEERKAQKKLDIKA